MAREDKAKVTDAELAEAKRYIRASGSGTISRAYFKETHCSIENIELESTGLYCFEKLVRLAFIQSMRDDEILGSQEGFIGYLAGLSKDFEAPLVRDWRPDSSAARASDFMISFYNLYSYQWKIHGRPAEKSLHRFLEIMRDCLDFGYSRLSEKFKKLPEDVKDIVNKAFFLTNCRIDAWYEDKSVEIQAA